MKAQYFSKHFGKRNTKRTDWFDPILGWDTKLFVDPFNIYKDSSGYWADAHSEIIQYFQDAFDLLAPVYDKPQSPAYKKVLHLMTFPEPRYFGLGYVEQGQGGSGTGPGFAKRMVEAMTIAIERGLTNIRHFEELTLLVEKIGPDRVSDMTCNILIERFVEYTQTICSRLAIPVQPLTIEHGVFDEQRQRWMPETYDLPKNPLTGAAVLLTPKRFLRELPQLDAYDWFDYNAAALRDDFNLDVNKTLNKTAIVRAARERPDMVRNWSAAAAGRTAKPYDVDTDPAGVHNWLARADAYAAANALTTPPPKTMNEMMDFIEECCKQFKHFVEQQGGWALLRNDDTGKAKREESIQLLFKGIVEHYCAAAGIILDREVELGRGPVDFIFTKTATLRALLEIKKMSNSNYWDGLESQLVIYMTSDDTKYGWFLPVRFTDSKNEKERHLGLAARVNDVKKTTAFDIRGLAVDARKPKSASKVKKAAPKKSVAKKKI